MKRIDYDLNGGTLYSDEDQNAVIPRVNDIVWLFNQKLYVSAIVHYPNTKFFSGADPIHIIAVELEEV